MHLWRNNSDDVFAIIFGRRGQGKSTLLRALQLGSDRPWLLIDPMREHAGRPQDALVRSEADPFDVVDRAAELLWQRGGPAVLAVDELDIAIRPGHQVPPALLHLVRYGRHKAVGLVLAARRPTDIPPSLAAQALDLFSFRQRHPRDLDYFRAVGLDAAQFAALGEHEYLHATDKGIHTHAGVYSPCVEETEE